MCLAAQQRVGAVAHTAVVTPAAAASGAAGSAAAALGMFPVTAAPAAPAEIAAAGAEVYAEVDAGHDI